MLKATQQCLLWKTARLAWGNFCFGWVAEFFWKHIECDCEGCSDLSSSGRSDCGALGWRGSGQWATLLIQPIRGTSNSNMLVSGEKREFEAITPITGTRKRAVVLFHPLEGCNGKPWPLVFACGHQGLSLMGAIDVGHQEEIPPRAVLFFWETLEVIQCIRPLTCHLFSLLFCHFNANGKMDSLPLKPRHLSLAPLQMYQQTHRLELLGARHFSFHVNVEFVSTLAVTFKLLVWMTQDRGFGPVCWVLKKKWVRAKGDTFIFTWIVTTKIQPYRDEMAFACCVRDIPTALCQQNRRMQLTCQKLFFTCTHPWSSPIPASRHARVIALCKLPSSTSYEAANLSSRFRLKSFERVDLFVQFFRHVVNGEWSSLMGSGECSPGPATATVTHFLQTVWQRPAKFDCSHSTVWITHHHNVDIYPWFVALFNESESGFGYQRWTTSDTQVFSSCWQDTHPGLATASWRLGWQDTVKDTDKILAQALQRRSGAHRGWTQIQSAKESTHSGQHPIGFRPHPGQQWSQSPESQLHLHCYLHPHFAQDHQRRPQLAAQGSKVHPQGVDSSAEMDKVGFGQRSHWNCLFTTWSRSFPEAHCHWRRDMGLHLQDWHKSKQFEVGVPPGKKTQKTPTRGWFEEGNDDIVFWLWRRDSHWIPWTKREDWLSQILWNIEQIEGGTAQEKATSLEGPLLYFAPRQCLPPHLRLHHGAHEEMGLQSAGTSAKLTGHGALWLQYFP